MPDRTLYELHKIGAVGEARVSSFAASPVVAAVLGRPPRNNAGAAVSDGLSPQPSRLAYLSGGVAFYWDRLL